MAIAGVQTQLIPAAPGTGGGVTERIVLTRDQLAHCMGVKPQTVNKMVSEGMPKLQHGHYDLAACWQWDRDQWRQRANDKAPSDSNERKRYDKARADQAELSLAERRRELIPITAVRDLVTRVVGIVVSFLEALPARLAPELATMTDPAEIQAKLTEAVHDARTDIGAALGDLGSDPKRRRASKPTAKKKRRPVGGRKAPTA